MAVVLKKIIHFLKQISVEPVLFLYMFIVFMESNALQSLFATKVCIMEYHPINISECAHKSELSSNKTVVGLASTWNKYYSGCMTFFTLISGFYVASWSDRFSRKIPMMIAPIGTLIAAAINLTLSMFIEINIAYYMITSVISGMSFGTVGVIAATFGHLSDIVTKEERTKRIVILEAMIFIGGTLGIYLAGALLKNTDIISSFNDYAKVFSVEIILALVITIYIIIHIPYKPAKIDDDDDEFLLNDSRPTSFGDLFSLSHIKDSFRTVFKQRSCSKRQRILLLLLALAIMYFGHAVQFTVSYLFVKLDPLKWDITEYSNYNAFQFAIEGIALIVGIPICFHVFHMPDLIIATIGVLSRIAGVALFGLSNSKALIYCSGALYIFSEFPIPAVKSVLSKLVDDDEKGRIFAFATIIQNICYFLAAFILPSIFHLSLPYFHGLCFEIIAILQVIALIIFLYLYLTPIDIITSYNVIEKDDGSTEETQTTMPIHRELDIPH